MSATIFLIGFTCIIWSVIMWYIELKPVLNRFFPGNILQNIIIFLKYGKAFVLDIIITSVGISFLGLGTGATGAIFGLFASNIISLVIIKEQRRRLKWSS